MRYPRGFSLPRGYIFGFAVLGMAMTLPGQTAGVSAFIDFLIAAMDMSRVRLSLAYLIGTLVSASILTPAGKLYDRLGSRVTGSATVAGLGMSLLALTRAPGVAAALVSVGMARPAAALLVMAVGFFLIRFFGQGVLELVSRTMLLKWFDDRRGLANAIFAGIMPVVFSLAPLAFDFLIRANGWQGAWRILGFTLVPGGMLITWLTFSDPPPRALSRGAGAGPDAVPGPGSPGRANLPVPAVLAPLKAIARRLNLRRTREPISPAVDRPLSYALRDFSFWVFLAVMTLSGGLVTGLTFHVVGVFAEAGIGRGAALAVFLPTSMVSVVALTFASVISDYVRLKYFAVLHGAALGCALLSILFLSRGPLAYAMVVLWLGIAMASMEVNQAVVWPRFYGLSHLGTISGFAAACMVAGSAIGPYAFSLAVDITGSFHAIVWVMAPICLIVAALGFLADNPNREFDS
ncbi:MAG: MFS transporter [Alkalispirochaeta sp.]